MTIRNLEALFDPSAIALIGASNKAGSVGAVIANNLVSGDFSKPIMPVNPHESTIAGRENHRSLSELPQAPDLAIIATPPATIPALIDELGANGCRGAIVITAGLDAQQRQMMLAAARPHLLRIVGPNCLGVLSTAHGINASFAHLRPIPGKIAFLTQSGAIATTMLDWANGRGIGFSHIVSLGDMADVDFGDLLDFLALDPSTDSILMYVEAVTHARKFMSAARIASRAKPVIVVKAGRGEAGARAARSHTGALAGADIVYDAAFRRAGMLRVETLRDLFDAAETLASGFRPKGDQLTILTNGGGLGVLTTDALEQRGGKLAPLKEAAHAALDQVLPHTWSKANPVDIIGDASAERYTAAIAALAESNEQDGLLVMNCPTGVADSIAATRAVIASRESYPRLPLLACWAGEATANDARQILTRAGIPTYETPDEAVGAFMQLVDYERNQKALLQTPALIVDREVTARARARDIIANAVQQERTVLTEPEAKTILALYGIPIVPTRTVATSTEAAMAAAEFDRPIALKILSRHLTHKSDVGGVALNLAASDVQSAAEAMLSHVRKAAPGAIIDGFTVQPMIQRPEAQELLLGMSIDRTFGAILLFGQGGIATEIAADRTIGLPPLNTVLARDMIGRTRVSKFLAGFRNRAAADLGAIANALVALSDLIIDIPEIAELDINPLLADAQGVIALDARIIVSASPNSGRLCIRPYPADLARDLELPDGLVLRMRPIRPTDAPLLIALAQRTSASDLRLRFHGAIRELTPLAAARLSQIDYDREMAFVATAPDEAVLGVARVLFNPDFESAEYAILVRSDLQGRGLGRRLLAEILGYARARGARRIWGDVLAGNHNMLTMAQEMGAQCHDIAPNLVRTSFNY